MGFFSRKIKEVKDEKINQIDRIHLEQQEKLNLRNGNLYLVDYENVHDDGLYGIETLKETDTVIIYYGNLVKNVSFESHTAMMASKAKIENMKVERTAKNYLDFQLATYLGYLIGKGHYNQIFIISKDTGFDSVVDFWLRRGELIERNASIVELPEKKTIEKVIKQVASKPKKEAVKKADKVKQNKSKTNNDEKAASSKQKAEKKVEDSKTVASTKQKAGESANVPESVRKKIRTTLKELQLPGSKYTPIYKALASTDNKTAYNNALQKVFGAQGADIFARTKSIWVEFHGQDSKGTTPQGAEKTSDESLQNTLLTTEETE